MHYNGNFSETWWVALGTALLSGKQFVKFCHATIRHTDGSLTLAIVTAMRAYNLPSSPLCEHTT